MRSRYQTALRIGWQPGAENIARLDVKATQCLVPPDIFDSGDRQSETEHVFASRKRKAFEFAIDHMGSRSD